MSDSIRDLGLVLAIDSMGSQSALGRLIGKRQSVVSDWLLSGKPLPAEYVLKVEAATGVSRHDLRPDLYPRDESVPSGRTGGAGFASAPAASHRDSAPVSADDKISPDMENHQANRNRGASPQNGAPQNGAPQNGSPHHGSQRTYLGPMVGDKAS